MQRKQPAPSSFLSDRRPTGRELPGQDRERAREPTGRERGGGGGRWALTGQPVHPAPHPPRHFGHCLHAAGGTQAAARPHSGWAGAYPRALRQRRAPPFPAASRGVGGSEDHPTARGRSNGRCRQVGSTAPVFRVGPMSSSDGTSPYPGRRGGGAPGAGVESGAPPPRKPKASPKPGTGSSPPPPP
ncbi:unnamed protein product [Nyctereutes procyonoides]|uniref:(raccoon dog) hypothetical protein n=1 Tax=Nyctereutes procyonoides TaxID=34880 RepID=A0A811YKB2_NYCPR|nr:unnamed protein product [Nyctereutes procyonoides]